MMERTETIQFACDGCGAISPEFTVKFYAPIGTPAPYMAMKHNLPAGWRMTSSNKYCPNCRRAYALAYAIDVIYYAKDQANGTDDHWSEVVGILQAIVSGKESANNHHCSGELPSGGYGAAIDHCISDGDTLWAGNDEYSSQVNFCPYCGAAAKSKPLRLARGNDERET